MKQVVFRMVMNLKSAHSAALQALGFSKDFVRDYSPIHRALSSIAFKLAWAQQ